MTKEISKLKNNINYIYKQNKNTPRIALCLNLSINKPEIKAGVYSLVARLLLQGTKKYNSEALANEFEKYAIDFSSEFFPNYMRIKFVCLNEDFSKAIELMNEVMVNSTFEEFEKEKAKLKGEISADLDSPKVIATDAYCKKFFGKHYYGNSITRVAEDIDTITKEDVISAYSEILNNSKKVLAIVGDIEKNTVLPKLNETLGNLPVSVEMNSSIAEPDRIITPIEVTNTKSGINQSHIVKGWQVSSYGENVDYPALILLNILLGASGLSSRLFLELRDKKGLAYVVRSVYETFKHIGNFMIYIATEPNNIETCLNGFDEEIEKIKSILVSEEELNNAKNNFIGKCAFLNETNLQQACLYAKNAIIGFDFEYSETLKKRVQEVTPQDILNCAQKYFTDNSVISIIKP